MSSQIISFFLIFAFLAERFLLSYVFSYAAAILALIALIIDPKRRDVCVIGTLTIIAIISEASLISIEIRYIAFIITFLVLTRLWACNPWLLFGLQIFFLMSAIMFPIVPLERFVFGSAVSAMILMMYLQKKPRHILRYVVEKLLLLTSLFLPFVGYGSRAALAVWLLVNWRVAVLAVPVAAISAGLLLNSFLVELPVFGKLLTSIDELSETAQATGAVSLRGMENEVFYNWLSEANLWQYLVGSGFEQTLPGYIIGNPFGEFLYIPHNYVFGFFFQFGILGTITILYIVYCKVNESSKIFEMKFIVFSIFFMGFSVKHGFFDTDLIMILAAINFIEMREVPGIRRETKERVIPHDA